MIKKISVLQILIILIIFFFPFSVVHSAELDRYKNSETEAPYYAPLPFEAYGQKVKGKEDIPFSITSISVNNEIVDITENNEVYVSKDDAVRIAGEAEPESKITIYFADKKIDVNVVENGNWLVLFSVTNLSDNRYIVSAKQEGMKESTTLFTLVVGSGKKIIQPVLDTETSQVSTFFDNKSQYFVYIFVILFSTALGWFLGTYSEKKKDSKGRIKRTKLRK